MTNLDHKVVLAEARSAVSVTRRNNDDECLALVSRGYLDLREKARNYLDCIEEGSMTPEVRDALRAILGDDHE